MKCSPKFELDGCWSYTRNLISVNTASFNTSWKRIEPNDVCIRLGFYASLSKMFFNFTSVKSFVCFSIHCSLTLSNWSKQQLIKLYKLIEKVAWISGHVDCKRPQLLSPALLYLSRITVGQRDGLQKKKNNNN